MERSYYRFLRCPLQIYTLELFFTGSSVIRYMKLPKGRQDILHLFLFKLNSKQFYFNWLWTVVEQFTGFRKVIESQMTQNLLQMFISWKRENFLLQGLNQYCQFPSSHTSNCHSKQHVAAFSSQKYPSQEKLQSRFLKKELFIFSKTRFTAVFF